MGLVLDTMVSLLVEDRFSSSYPLADGTMYPTQSIILILAVKSSISILVAVDGMNFGSVVIMVFPAAACGSSSRHLFLSYSSVILGIIKFSINFLMNVDFPVRTAPTTPKYMSPPDLFPILFYNFCFFFHYIPLFPFYH